MVGATLLDIADAESRPSEAAAGGGGSGVGSSSGAGVRGIEGAAAASLASQPLDHWLVCPGAASLPLAALRRIAAACDGIDGTALRLKPPGGAKGGVGGGKSSTAALPLRPSRAALWQLLPPPPPPQASAAPAAPGASSGAGSSPGRERDGGEWGGWGGATLATGGREVPWCSGAARSLDAAILSVMLLQQHSSSRRQGRPHREGCWPLGLPEPSRCCPRSKELREACC